MTSPVNRAFNPKRKVNLGLALHDTSAAMDRIQSEKVGRAMATQQESQAAGWDTNPEVSIQDLNAVHNATGIGFPMSGAALSSYRAEKGLPQ